MDIRKRIVPSFLRDWDHYLLLHHPLLWSSRIHFITWYGVEAMLLLLLLIWLYPINPNNVPEVAPLCYIVILLSCIPFIYWLSKQRQYDDTAINSTHKFHLLYRYIVYLCCVAIFAGIPYIFFHGLSSKIASLISEEKLLDDVNKLKFYELVDYSYATPEVSKDEIIKIIVKYQNVYDTEFFNNTNINFLKPKYDSPDYELKNLIRELVRENIWDIQSAKYVSNRDILTRLKNPASLYFSCVVMYIPVFILLYKFDLIKYVLGIFITLFIFVLVIEYIVNGFAGGTISPIVVYKFSFIAVYILSFFQIIQHNDRYFSARKMLALVFFIISTALLGMILHYFDVGITNLFFFRQAASFVWGDITEPHYRIVLWDSYEYLRILSGVFVYFVLSPFIKTRLDKFCLLPKK